MGEFEQYLKREHGCNGDVFIQQFGSLQYLRIKDAWQNQQSKIEQLEKRLSKISNYATELAEYASYAEIVGAVSHNRQPIREYCEKIFAYNRAADLEEEKALRGDCE